MPITGIAAAPIGYTAAWVRDVPLPDPSFGDLGKIHDPWVYLGWIAGHTQTIPLATGSIVLPLRHPLHPAKAAGSVDQLSGGRLVPGLASGDRRVEFPAFGVDIGRRAVLFRDHFEVVRRVLKLEYPALGRPARSPATPTLYPSRSGAFRCSSPETAGSHCRGSPGMPTAGSLIPAASIARPRRWRAGAVRSMPPARAPSSRSFDRSTLTPPKIRTCRLRRSTSASGRGGTSCCAFSTRCAVVGVNHITLNPKYGTRPASEVLEEIGTEVLPPLADVQGDKPAGGELEPSDARVDDALAPQH